MANILQKTIEEIHNSLKHPGHGDEKVHGRKKSFSQKAKQIIDKSLFDYIDYSDESIYSEDSVMSNMSSKYEDWQKKLSISQQKAIKSYTGVGYETINRDLRNDDMDNSTYYDEIIDIDDSLQNSQVQEDIVLRRAIGNGNIKILKQMESLQNGDVWEDKGYVSTSVMSTYDSGVLMKIRVPKSSNGIYVGYDNLSDMPYEAEMILMRGSRFYVNSNTVSNGLTTLDVTLLPND